MISHMVIIHSRTLQHMKFYVKPLEIKCRFIYSCQGLKTCFIRTLAPSYCIAPIYIKLRILEEGSSHLTSKKHYPSLVLNSNNIMIYAI